MHVHGAELRAALEGWNGLAWVQDPPGIECAFDAMELIQLVVVSGAFAVILVGVEPIVEIPIFAS